LYYGHVPDYDWYSDTDPRALQVFLELQRRMSPAEKIQAVFRLTEMVTRMVQASIRKQYPTASEREVFLRTAARHLDRETMIRVYGWNPE
jgi:predicted RNA-binding Zn ribbon-like protein